MFLIDEQITPPAPLQVAFSCVFRESESTELSQLFLLLVRGHTWTWQKLPESRVPYRLTDHAPCPIASDFFMCIPGVKNTEFGSAFFAFSARTHLDMAKTPGISYSL